MEEPTQAFRHTSERAARDCSRHESPAFAGVAAAKVAQSGTLFG